MSFGLSRNRFAEIIGGAAEITGGANFVVF
jgi:hypothetical protein